MGTDDHGIERLKCSGPEKTPAQPQALPIDVHAYSVGYISVVLNVGDSDSKHYNRI